MAKICNANDCTFPQFGGGFCKYHQYLRKDKKPKQIKKSGFIKKGVNTKKKMAKYTLFGFTNQRELFIHLWNVLPHKSVISNRNLNHFGPIGSDYPDIFWSMFAHVLSKADNKFPKWILNPSNIVILHPEEHTLIDHGNSDQRMKYEEKHNCPGAFEKFFNLQRELTKQYEIWLKENENM